MNQSLQATQATRTDATGKMAGEYLLGRKLGEGGCGAVYEAEHPLLKRRAAVKVLHRVPMVGSTGLARFIAEAKTVNQIRSKHIVDVFSFGELDDGRPFYVMDLLEGEPLDRYLARLGPLSVPAALQIVRPIAQALDIAHRAGIVHRDLKPQNVFLACESSGEVVVKLLDFGVAKLLHEAGALTLSGAVIGTPLYMSPEQARGGSVDARSDVYALGVLCYELLTGDVPLRADTVLAVAMAHVVQPPKPPSAVAELPTALDAPILQMLAKLPEQRPASAGAALMALCRAAESAGFAIPIGLLDLPRPQPLPPDARALSTTVGDESLARSSERPRDRSLAPSTHAQGKSGTASARVRIGALLALSLALLIAGYLTLFAAPAQQRPLAPHAVRPTTAPVAATIGARSLAATPAPPSAPALAPLSAPSPVKAAPGSTALDVPAPQAPPSGSAATATSTLSAADAGVAPQRAAARRKLRGFVPPRRDAIPSDLENPF